MKEWVTKIILVFNRDFIIVSFKIVNSDFLMLIENSHSGIKRDFTIVLKQSCLKFAK